MTRDEQILASLEIANSVRVERARIKRDIKGGRTSILTTLANPPASLQSAKVIDLLILTPRVGRVTARGWLKRADISLDKRLSEITDRQRGALVKIAELGKR